MTALKMFTAVLLLATLGWFALSLFLWPIRWSDDEEGRE